MKRDEELWIETHIKIRWYKKKLKNNFLKQILIGFAWLSPALVITILAISYQSLTPWNYLLAILWVTLYHFISMYYIIEVSDTVKIECYSIDQKKKTNKKKK